MKTTVPTPPAELEQSLSQRWLDLLAAEGYRPQLHTNDLEPSRTRLYFKSAGEPHFLYLDARDPLFFQLSLKFRLADDDAPDFALLAAANERNRLTKATKVSVDLQGREACFDVEGFLDGPPSGAVLERMISQCRLAADRFFALLRRSGRPVPLAS
jgi:hypothetical protein